MRAELVCAQDAFFNATDKVLIDSTLHGNHSAFAELVTRYQQKLFAALFRVAESADLAEELVQDAFVQAYLKLDTFRHQAAFSTWLFRIAFNKYLSVKRSARRTRSLEPLEEDRPIQPIDPGESAEEMCMRSEERKQLNDALTRLDAKTRTILVLRELDGLSYEEIGVVLDLKIGTVRSQLSRARSKLLRELSLESVADD